MSAALALRHVYEVFSTVPRPRRIDACPCCISEDDVCTLLTKSPIELSAEDLAPYAASVFYTAGGESDFRYFLPRILEIATTDHHWWPNLEVVLKKLPLANWGAWAPRERKALEALFAEAFAEALRSQEDPAWLVDSWLCGIALAELDVKPYLRRLEATEYEPILVHYYEQNAEQVAKGKLSNAFWGDGKLLAKPIVEWLGSPLVTQVLQRHYNIPPAAPGDA